MHSTFRMDETKGFSVRFLEKDDHRELRRAYMASIHDAIQNRWFDLLQVRGYAVMQKGQVLLRFRLHANGSVTDLEILGSDVELALSLLCQSAVRDPSPYDLWPKQMRDEMTSDSELLTLVFIYAP
jgi:hypothetical protein